MSQKKYLVTLTPDERGHLADLLRKGKASALVLTRARILPAADQADGGPTLEDAVAAEEWGVGLRTTGRVRQRFVERGFEDCLRRKTQDRPSRVRTPDGVAEARLVALARSAPPDDRAAWAMQLPADESVELKVVDAVSDETVRRAMKKAWSGRGSGSRGASRPGGAFVAAVEDVTGVYHRPPDPGRPVVCLDEQPTRLLGEARTPIPAKPGQPRRYDYADTRNGTADLFLAFAPLAGWRHVSVTGRRTAKAFGAFPRRVVDEVYAEAEKVVLVTDNLNVHGVGRLYEAFDPATARRVAAKIEWHYTPNHGSWLNAAGCEFAVLTRQCPGRRIGTMAELRRRIGAWENARNERRVEAKWRFTTADARIKLHRLYPSTQ